MSVSTEYTRYLQSRGRLGFFYRTKWLYPYLSRWLSGRVLDVGCGIGDMLQYQQGCIGVDVNESNVALCQSKGLSAQVMENDRLPFDAASFDSVVLDNVLEHIEEPRPLLGEIHRVLAKQGVLVVGVPGVKGYAADPDHKQYYDRDRLVSTLSSAGFECLHLKGMPLDWEVLSSKITPYCIYAVFRRV